MNSLVCKAVYLLLIPYFGGYAAVPRDFASSSPITEPPPVDEDITEDVSQHKKLNLLPLDICGPITENRLMLRRTAWLNEFPWIALIAYSAQTAFPYKCAGSLISSRYVLTAANCVKNLPPGQRPISVRLGEYDLDSAIDCDLDIYPEDKYCAPKPQDIEIEEVIPHPKYVGQPNMMHDIALLRLAKPANMTLDSVKPICLPIGLPQQTKDFEKVRMILAGWGISLSATNPKILLKTAIPVVSNQQCEAAFKGKVQISGVTQICANGAKSRKHSCFGDSGGPLNHYDEVQSYLKTVLQGIASFGPKNCQTMDMPSVYTRVGHYMKWILDTMRP